MGDPAQTPGVPLGAHLGAFERFLALDAPAAPLVAVARALSRFRPSEISTAIEVLIALQDLRDGDADREDDDPAEAVGDEMDSAWLEWCGLHPAKRRGPNMTAGHEDDEEDDDPAQCTEDEVSTMMWAACGGGAGCKISDPDHGIDDLPHDQEHDAEVEQIEHDVPALPVFTAEHNIFSDSRTFIGMNAATFIGAPLA